MNHPFLVASPNLIETRMSEISKNKAFDVIKKINYQLAINPIRKDYSIDVFFDYIMDATLLEQLQDVYQSRGWNRITPNFIPATDDFVDRTVITFHTQ